MAADCIRHAYLCLFWAGRIQSAATPQEPSLALRDGRVLDTFMFRIFIAAYFLVSPLHAVTIPHAEVFIAMPKDFKPE